MTRLGAPKSADFLRGKRLDLGEELLAQLAAQSPWRRRRPDSRPRWPCATCTAAIPAIQPPRWRISPVSPATMPSSMMAAFKVGRSRLAVVCTSWSTTMASTLPLCADSSRAIRPVSTEPPSLAQGPDLDSAYGCPHDRHVIVSPNPECSVSRADTLLSRPFAATANVRRNGKTVPCRPARIGLVQQRRVLGLELPRRVFRQCGQDRSEPGAADPLQNGVGHRGAAAGRWSPRRRRRNRRRA